MRGESKFLPQLLVETLQVDELTCSQVGSHRMPSTLDSRDVNMEFIKLLFTDPAEEQLAYRWASRFANLLGAQASLLRPSSTLAEMLLWAAAARVDPMDFVVVFEPELRMEFAHFLDCAELVTFREMVQHLSRV